MSRNKPAQNGADELLRSRRRFLALCAGASATILTPSAFARAISPHERKLGFYNTHTGETLNTTYWAEGEYIQDALKDINWLLRDHRANQAHTMDRKVLDMLYVLQNKLDNPNSFQVISAYRSPSTNALLRKNSNGVAKKSLHMQGKAIDIRLPGTELVNVRKAALAMRAGGVGYYPKSNFVHLDIGRVRRW
jgi:uncharacterized protein YcbK (DUF882 family)